MRRDFSEAPRSPSILPFNQRVFPSRSILFSLHPLISFPPNTLISHSLLLSPLSLSLSHRSLSLSSFLFPLPLRQVPGQLHGRRQGRLHERKPPQRHAHHHPAQEVHGAHQDHLPTGQEAQAGIASPDGGGRRPGQPAGGGRPRGGPVPRVRCGVVAKASLCLLIDFSRTTRTSPPFRFSPSPSPAIRVDATVVWSEWTCMFRWNTGCLICSYSVIAAVCSSSAIKFLLRQSVRKVCKQNTAYMSECLTEMVLKLISAYRCSSV